MSYSLIGIWIVLALSVVCFLSWEIIYTRGLWYMKAVSSAIVIFLIFYSVFTWRSIQGTPKYIANPEGLLVRSYMIKEPKKDQKGKIWLWITDPNKPQEPFNIEIPYSKQTHKNLMENRGFTEGRAQIIRKNKKQNNDNSESDRQFRFEDPVKLIQKEN